MKRIEPCLCGDPECRRCFPRYGRSYRDPDEEYDRKRQERLERELNEGERKNDR